MAQETLKLVITADNADALAKIKQFSESLGAQTTQWERNKKATGDATNALTNFSRLAEDSAYGLRGAANNINPFIESFKRLKDETGSTKAALLSMAQGLIGPAGILVAVSAISSIWIKYSDAQNKAKKDAEELAKADNSSAEAIKKKKEAIESIYDTTAKEATQVSTLIAIINSETESRNRKKDALKELQKINPEIFNGLKIEGDAVKGINNAYKDYIDNLGTIIALKIKQKELEDVTEKLLKNQGITLSEDEKFLKKVGDAYRQNRINTASDVEARKIATQVQTEKNKKESEEIILLEKRDRILKAIGELSKGAKITGAGGGGDADKKDPFVEATKEYNNAVQNNLDLRSKDLISQKTYFENYEKIVQAYLNKIKNIDTEQAKNTLKKLTPKELIKSVSDTYDSDLEAKAAAMDAFDFNPLKKGANIQGNEATPYSEKAFENGKNQLDKFFKENNKIFKQAERDAKEFNEKYTQIINGIAQDISEKLGETLGELLSGGDLRSALQSFLTILADGLINVGKLAIATGLAIEGIKEALKSLNPVAAIGAGVALIALGSFVKSQLKKQGDSIGNTPKLAEGGVVNKPTYALIGEGNETEAVMPLSKLKGFLNTSFNAGAMSGTGAGNGQFVLKGNDLVLALQRSNYNLNLRRGI